MSLISPAAARKNFYLFDKKNEAAPNSRATSFFYNNNGMV